jgi:aldose 1-epimerase
MDVAPPAAVTAEAPALSGHQWTIASDGHEATVVEVGGGLRTYRHDGIDLIDAYGPDEVCPGSAGQVLAPWPNRIRDGEYTFDGVEYELAITEPERNTALHGLVNWSRWHAVDVTPSSVTVECALVPVPGYPWPLVLRTTWSVGPAGLTAAHEAANVGTVKAPFGLAVHPYLIIPGQRVEDLVLEIPGQTRLLVDGRQLPIGAAKVAGTDYDFTGGRRIGAAVLDLAFGDPVRDEAGHSFVRLLAPDGSGVACWADGSFNWWQVFTGDTLDPPRTRRSVAVEPMTCPADAFRTGRDLMLLAPGQTWRASWGIGPVAG